MQHIAVCDLMLSTWIDLIRLVSLLFGDWMFGEVLCQWFNFLQYYLNLASVLLICNLTTNKVLLLKYPFRYTIKRSKEAHILCSVCWVLALVAPMTTLFVDAKDVKFSNMTYKCNYAFSSKVWRYLRPILAVVFILTPILLVIVTSLYLIVIARQVAHRGRNSLKLQGIITIALTATVFCLSFLPYFLVLMGKSIFDEEFTSLEVYDHIYRAAISFNSINIISNFYIYSLAVHSFRIFVLSRIQLFCRLITAPIQLIQTHTQYIQVSRFVIIPSTFIKIGTPQVLKIILFSYKTWKITRLKFKIIFYRTYYIKPIVNYSTLGIIKEEEQIRACFNALTSLL